MKLLKGEKTAAKATSSTIPRFWFLVKIEYATACSIGAARGDDEIVVDGTAFSAIPLPLLIVDIEQRAL